LVRVSITETNPTSLLVTYRRLPSGRTQAQLCFPAPMGIVATVVSGKTSVSRSMRTVHGAEGSPATRSAGQLVGVWMTWHVTTYVPGAMYAWVWSFSPEYGPLPSPHVHILVYSGLLPSLFRALNRTGAWVQPESGPVTIGVGGLETWHELATKVSSDPVRSRSACFMRSKIHLSQEDFTACEADVKTQNAGRIRY